MVVLIGLVLIPYPGPGWLVVFAGLAILSTEFVFASRLLKYGRKKYDDWTGWLLRQNGVIQITILAFTCFITVATLWLLNVFGFFVQFLGLPFDWLISPFFR